ncbi:alpha/beta hydrolase [Falsiroseomonas sp. HW251]|uniref:alpha/beta hydrolase n=1 Tax=Falsiroseomonas sp. HW251 TaxID=3390998 RepID=UPI003D311C51
MKRRFADLDTGQVHYREGGAGGTPLVMLHGGAANGASLLPIARVLAATRAIIVPDMPGCGDSDALPIARPEVEDIADWLIAFLHALGIETCDLHGAHLGARVAIEAALRHPARLRRIILDGIGFYDEEARQRMLGNVAPEIIPDPDGAYLAAAHAMCRDYHRYFPWFARDPAHRRDGPEPSPATVHAKLVEVIRNGTTYPLPYRAALRHPTEQRLPLLTHPVLLAFARTDNVFPQRARAAALLPAATTAETPGAADPAGSAAIFAAFLDAEPART